MVDERSEPMKAISGRRGSAGPFDGVVALLSMSGGNDWGVAAPA